MSTNQNGTALNGGKQAPQPTLRVRINPTVSRKDASWAIKALQAIGADNAPALSRLLAEKKRPVFGQNCTFQEDGQSQTDAMTFLEFALIAQSNACIEVLIKLWHAADLDDEVETAITPFLEAYESRPEHRSSPRFHLPMAAVARGLFKSQAATEDYGVSSFNYEYPLASQAIARIYAEQTPKPDHGTKLYIKRAYWLRRAAANIADNDAGELTASLAELAVLPHTLPKDEQYLELNLLLMSCVSMRRTSCSAPIFKFLAQMGDVQIINSFNHHFLTQLASHLSQHAGVLSATEEDELAAGLASVVISLDRGSLSKATSLSVLASKEFNWLVGNVGVIASKAVLQVQCELEREELDAITLSKSVASIGRTSSAL